MMTYDLNGAWDNTTGLNAPLWARNDEEGRYRTQNMVSFCSDNFVNKPAFKNLYVLFMKNCP